MSIVTFELDDLKRLGIEGASLSEAIERLGMSLEAMDRNSVTIDITPNRADMLDVVGFARAAAFLLGKKAPKEKFYSISSNPATRVSVSPEKKIQPFIAALVVRNVDLSGNRLRDLVSFTEKFCETYGRKRRKISMGIYNLDAIKGPLEYGASREGKFIPLGRKTSSGFGEILKEHEKGIEYSTILGKSKKYPFLSDSQKIIALIPIVNSEDTKVTTSTRNLFIDVTGTTIESTDGAINMTACSFIDMGAEVQPCEIVYRKKKRITPQLEYRTIRLKNTRIEKTLGVYLEENKIVGLANRLGHVAAKYGKYTLLYIPPYRLDMLNEQDAIEDIAIAYGYDKIGPQPVLGFSTGTPEESTELINRTARLLLGLGLTEVINPYLTNEELNFRMLGRKSDSQSEVITIAYAKTEAITMLRTDLLPWLMENLSKSAKERTPQRLFETGKVFRLNEGNVIERTNIAMASLHSKANYSEIKSLVIELMEFAGIVKYELIEYKDPAFIEGRAAKIMVGKETLGHFGEISPKAIDNFRLEEPVVAAEISLEALMKQKKVAPA